MSVAQDIETNLPNYSDADKQHILSIAEWNRDKIDDTPIHQNPIFIYAVGTRGSGNTTALLKFSLPFLGLSLFRSDEWDKNGLSEVVRVITTEPTKAAWISKDRGFLYELTEAHGHGGSSDKKFYDYWQSAAKFLSDFTLTYALQRQVDIIYDTLSPDVDCLVTAKQEGYHTITLCSASPRVIRQDALIKRNSSYYQPLPTNMNENDKVFIAHLPSVIQNSDEMHFMWRETANEHAICAAVTRKGEGAICISDSFAKICAEYPIVGQQLSVLNHNPALCDEYFYKCEPKALRNVPVLSFVAADSHPR